MIGYFQQGEELRLNTEALKAQQEELRRQVEETHVLARNAERQAVASESLALLTKTEQEQQALRERAEAEPKLIYTGGARTRQYTEWSITNVGGDISNVELEFEEGIGKVTGHVPPVWKRDERVTIKIYSEEAPISYPLSFQVHYQDKLGGARTKEFKFLADNDLSEVPHATAMQDGEL